MTRYNLTQTRLLSEYMNFSEHSLRFGQYIINKYGEGSDSEVFYENNNGVAYKMILNRIFQQELKDSGN